MRVGEAEPLREIPIIDTSGDDDLIKMAMIGAFLVGYNTVRAAVDAGEDISAILSGGKLSELKHVAEAMAPSSPVEYAAYAVLGPLYGTYRGAKAIREVL